MQSMIVLQSLWAMERRHPDGVEPLLEESIRRIADAGFDGISAHWYDRAYAGRVAEAMRGVGLAAVEGQCFPKTVDDLKPVLEVCAEHRVHHVNVQPDVRTRDLGGAVKLVEGWMRLAEEADIPVYVETHRDRLTNDLLFTLDLLNEVPAMPLLIDLSHYLVGHEFAYPVTDETKSQVRRILDNASAFHGRVGSCGQVQIELSYPHHATWVELFREWWDYGFASWRRRAGSGDVMSFTCELGPRPYAIIDREGNDTTDRWQESLQLKTIAEEIWSRAPAPRSAVER